VAQLSPRRSGRSSSPGGASSTPTPPRSWRPWPPRPDPGGRDLRRQGRGPAARWWQLGGIGLEGTPATNELAREADLVLTVGSRLTDFATASQSLFQRPEVRFAGVNVNPYDAGRLGATGIVADAKRALAALTEAVRRAGTSSPADWQERVQARNRQWQAERAAALDPDTPFDLSTLEPDSDVVAGTGAVLTQGQIIGLLQEHARPGDVIIAAAGGPPGDLQKVWDATEGRFTHLEFGVLLHGL
jgi:3D-(3,5/4)-trihydroxycyclohexane-1,2-dione acylhydrolase (decyclizing)